MNNLNSKFEVLPLCSDLTPEKCEDTGATEVIRSRRVPRISVEYSDPAVYLGFTGMQQTAYRVKTLAELGAGFLSKPGGRPGEVAWRAPAYIGIGEIRIPVTSRMVYRSDAATGVEFINPNDKIRLAIRSHFCLEFAAATLKPVYESVPSSPGLQKVSFQGVKDFGLELMVNQDRLLSFRANIGTLGYINCLDGRNIFVSVYSNSPPETRALRAQIMSFMRNIRGLNPRVRQALYTKVLQTPLDVEIDRG